MFEVTYLAKRNKNVNQYVGRARLKGVLEDQGSNSFSHLLFLTQHYISPQLNQMVKHLTAKLI